jgi:transaldolase
MLWTGPSSFSPADRPLDRSCLHQLVAAERIAMTKLNDLYDQQGQSPWLDNLRRDWLQDGKLGQLVSEGIRGVTSNPTIFAKAISGQDTYDDEFKSLIATMSVEDAYWALVIDDINNALRILRPVFDSSNRGDGYVSVEVAPALAHDTDGTITAARSLHARIDQPNLLVKIPATVEGIPAIQKMISEGRSINVTLIFSISRYDQVIDAYISGLEEYAASGATDLSSVASVGSFFVSRVDTEVDRRIEAAAGGSANLLALRGQAAVAQARQAYRLFTQRFSGDRWDALAAKGAHVQRPLWASTSTKNPAYPDLAYVDTLIGPDTVNTLPDETISAFLDHGTVARTIDTDFADADRVMAALADAGIDMEDVGRTLEAEGVASFSKSFDELIQALTDKANALTA